MGCFRSPLRLCMKLMENTIHESSVLLQQTLPLRLRRGKVQQSLSLGLYPCAEFIYDRASDYPVV